MALDLREEEKVLLVKRRHKIIVIFKLVAVFFAVAAIFAATTFLTTYVGHPAATLSAIALLMIALMSVFHFLADYYLDIWIITDERALRVELKGFFNRTLKSIYHDKIQDIKVEVKGVLPTLLDYGSVRIQTAGAHAEFVFEDIPEPYKVKEKVYAIADDYRKKQAQPRVG